MKGANIIGALYIYYTECIKMNKNVLKSIWNLFYKCILCLIMVAIFAILFIQIFYLYEEKKFIDNCVKEGDTQKHCQSIWSEIDALN